LIWNSSNKQKLHSWRK